MRFGNSMRIWWPPQPGKGGELWEDGVGPRGWGCLCPSGFSNGFVCLYFFQVVLAIFTFFSRWFWPVSSNKDFFRPLLRRRPSRTRHTARPTHHTAMAKHFQRLKRAEDVCVALIAFSKDFFFFEKFGLIKTGLPTRRESFVRGGKT